MPNIIQLRRNADRDDPSLTTWVDVDLRDDDSREWIERQSGLSADVSGRLLEPGSVSRREIIGDGLLIRIRIHPESEQTVESESDSFRVWVERDRVITVRSTGAAACYALRAIATDAENHLAPFEIVAFLVRRNVDRFEPIISEIFADTSQLEDRVLDADDEEVDEDLLAIRRRAMHARRHLVELRNLLVFTTSDESLLLSEPERRALASAKNHVLTFLESLDDCQARTSLLNDQIESRMSARLSGITYNLTLVATVFLPLSFLTGLLGMNIAGIPEEHDPRAFSIVCVVMVLIAICFWLFFRWRRWV